jgi:hypothetical protein
MSIQKIVIKLDSLPYATGQAIEVMLPCGQTDIFQKRGS